VSFSPNEVGLSSNRLKMTENPIETLDNLPECLWRVSTVSSKGISC
jgi:hypothetical protein